MYSMYLVSCGIRTVRENQECGRVLAIVMKGTVVTAGV
jgi:hypothetical protein